MLPIVWTDSARWRVRETIDYISDFNEAAAISLEGALRDAVDRLANFPDIGRPGRVEGTREFIFHPNYLIVYRVGASAIVILNFLHARRRYP